MPLILPDQSEPVVRDGRTSRFWYTFFSGLEAAVNSTVSGLAGAVAAVSDVYAAVAGKTFTTGLLEDAAAYVALSDAATVALDWDTFINGEVTITADRQLGNPSNGQPGTYRSVLVKGNNSTDRTISYGSNFKGSLPTVTDIDSATWYEFTIKCHSTTHFSISSKLVLP